MFLYERQLHFSSYSLLTRGPGVNKEIVAMVFISLKQNVVKFVQVAPNILGNKNNFPTMALCKVYLKKGDIKAM